MENQTPRLARRYTCEEVAEAYRVPIQTVWAWIRDRRLKAIRLNEGYKGKYRIRQEDLEEFERTRLTMS